MTRPEPLPGMLAALASYEGLFGPYHPQTLALATALAVALCASGNSVEGRRLLERTIGDLTKHHGRHHPVLIRALEAWSALACQESNVPANAPRSTVIS